MTGPGTAPTGRPSCAAKSAVVSEPERSVASTTTVAAASPAMIRLRATKHQRYGVKPGGSSETTAPRSDELAVQAPARRRVRDVGAAGEHGDRPRPAPCADSAPTWAAESTPEREAGDHRHAGRGQPAPEPARDLDARTASRAARRRWRRPSSSAVSAATDPGDVEHRRRIGELAQRRRDRPRRSGRRRSARAPRIALPRAGRRSKPACPRATPPGRPAASSASSGSDSTPGGRALAPPLDVELRGDERGDEARSARRQASQASRSCRERERLVVEAERGGLVDVVGQRRGRCRPGRRSCARRAGCGRGRARRGGCGRRARAASGAAPPASRARSSRSARAVICALQVRPVPREPGGLALAGGDDPLADARPTAAPPGRAARRRTGRPTVTETSMRSSSGPLSRRWWRARSAAEQRQALLPHAARRTGSRRRRA